MEQKRWTDIFSSLVDLDMDAIINKGRHFLNSMNDNTVYEKADAETRILIMMAEDYLSGHYINIRKSTLLAILYALFYTVVPSHVMKSFLGEKTLGRSFLVYSICTAMIYSEVQKYKIFLKNNTVVTTTELGSITYYKHRMLDTCNKSDSALVGAHDICLKEQDTIDEEI